MGNFFKKNYIILILLSISILWGILNFDILLNEGGDNGRYMMLGRSIIYGKFMREINTPQEDLHKQYPPFYPFLLSIMMLIFGKENIFMMKVLSLTFYVLSVLVFYKILTKYIKGNLGLKILLCGLFIFSKNIVEWSSLILTESLYIFLVLMIIYFFKKYRDDKKISSYILLLIFSTLMVFTRGNGTIVFFALFLFIIVEKEKRLFPITFLFFLLSQTWGIYLFIKTGHTSSYFQQVIYKNIYLPSKGLINIKTFFQRILFNLTTYFTTIIPKSYIGKIKPTWYYFIFILIPIITFIGSIINSFYKKKYIFEISFLLLNIMLLLIWPEYFSTDRFFAPFFSLFLLLTTLFLLEIKIKKSFILYTYFLFLLICIGLNISFLSSDIPRKNYMLKETDFNFRNDNRFRPEFGIRTFYDLAIWSKNNVEDDAVIMTAKPELFYIFSNRKTVIFPYTYEAKTVIDYIKKNRVKYVVYENTKNPKRLANLTINVFINSYRNYFSYVYTVKDRPFYILLKVDTLLYYQY